MPDHAEAKSRPIPSEKADTWDLEVKILAERLGERRKELHKGMGVRPFKGKKVSLGEQKASMAGMTSEDWGQLIQEYARIKEDGRILLPNTIIAQARKINKMTLTEGENSL